jgi:hypothetical protein
VAGILSGVSAGISCSIVAEIVPSFFKGQVVKEHKSNFSAVTTTPKTLISISTIP